MSQERVLCRLDDIPDGQSKGFPAAPGAFPNAEAAAAEILSLPLFPGITESQQDRVVDALMAAVS